MPIEANVLARVGHTPSKGFPLGLDMLDPENFTQGNQIFLSPAIPSFSTLTSFYTATKFGKIWYTDEQALAMKLQ